MSGDKHEIKSRVQGYLDGIIARHDFVFSVCEVGGMGEWYVLLENKDFTITVSRERGAVESIDIGCKQRPKPRAQLRSWPLTYLRGYLEGAQRPLVFSSLKEESFWLQENADTLMNCALLNSDEMHKWSVTASRRGLQQ